MVTALLELAGFTLVVAAATRVSVTLGLFVAGLGLMVGANLAARGTGKGTGQ